MTILDHFRPGEIHWVEVESDFDGGYCWIPIEQLDDSDPFWDEEDWYGSYEVEFDVWLDELASAMGEELLAAGIIRIFDIGDTVAGIEFEIDPDDRETVASLAEIYVDDDSGLSYYAWEALVDLEGHHARDPDLVRMISRALED